jgi:hypothetical protein
MKTRKIITLAASDEIYSWLLATYGGRATGARLSIESYHLLRRKTLVELFGIFKKDELEYMLNRLNVDSLVMPRRRSAEQMIKVLLIARCEERPGRISDFEGLIKKLKSLTEAQAFMLADRLLEALLRGETLEALDKSLAVPQNFK